MKNGVYNTLKTIVDRWKLPITLISDTGITPGRILKEMLAHHDVLKYFQATIFSDETGRNKPDAKPFQLAIQSLQCSADQVIHTGDLLHTDVIGAQTAGMKAIWFRPDFKLSPNSFNPDYIIDNFTEILPIIERLT